MVPEFGLSILDHNLSLMFKCPELFPRDLDWKFLNLMMHKDVAHRKLRFWPTMESRWAVSQPSTSWLQTINKFLTTIYEQLGSAAIWLFVANGWNSGAASSWVQRSWPSWGDSFRHRSLDAIYDLALSCRMRLDTSGTVVVVWELSMLFHSVDGCPQWDSRVSVARTMLDLSWRKKTTLFDLTL